MALIVALCVSKMQLTIRNGQNNLVTYHLEICLEGRLLQIYGEAKQKQRMAAKRLVFVSCDGATYWFSKPSAHVLARLSYKVTQLTIKHC